MTFTYENTNQNESQKRYSKTIYFAFEQKNKYILLECNYLHRGKYDTHNS